MGNTLPIHSSSPTSHGRKFFFETVSGSGQISYQFFFFCGTYCVFLKTARGRGRMYVCTLNIVGAAKKKKRKKCRPEQANQRFTLDQKVVCLYIRMGDPEQNVIYGAKKRCVPPIRFIQSIVGFCRRRITPRCRRRYLCLHGGQYLRDV
jgi:hypothetical protein